MSNTSNIFAHLIPGCTVEIEGTHYEFVRSEKKGRWDYVIVKDKKGKQHEFTSGKVERVIPKPVNPTPEPQKEAPVSTTTEPKKADTPKAEKPKPTPPAPRPKTPYEQMSILNQGFERYRQAHPASMSEALGRPVQGNGDDVDAILRVELEENGDDIYSCPTVMKHLNVDELKAKYAHLNKGMQRMNVGNRLRGVLHNADKKAEQAKMAEARKAEMDQKKAKKAEEKAAAQAHRDQRKAEKAEVEAKRKAEKEAKKAE